jgi:hypothetical protein
MISEKIKAKARRLKALAVRGIDGEKDNAIRMYAEYMKKHGIQEKDVDASKNNRKFKVKNDDDALILYNIILAINPCSVAELRGLQLYAELDDEDYIEVLERFRYFVKLYRLEKKLFEMAFMHKHSAFFQPDEYAMSKFREQRKTNEQMEKAKQEAEKANKKAQDLKDDEKAKDINNAIKKTSDSNLMSFNLDRMPHMAKILLDAKYVRARKSVSKK